ncbi:MAG: methyltransferase domain-containing protein [Actinomycetota bacterium]|nr:methyltransferase domain-containing protein [Actinomycetota bacterium]MDP9496699.1 methyltransferase domain-containing protein [Actinomycetota bacterium]
MTRTAATPPDGARPAVPPTYADCNRLWVDSRPRALAQRVFEARVLRCLGGRVEGGRVLEIGPGRRGTGLRLAVEEFGAASAVGVELFDESVRACRRAVADLGGRVRVLQGDATALDAADGSYDAVFCYHLLHHADDWRAAVREAARVLRPGGRLYVAEMTARFVDSRPLRAVSLHPADGDRPTPGGVAAAVRDAGLEVVARHSLLGWWLALVARKPAG